MLEETKAAIKNGKCRDRGNIRHMTQNEDNKTKTITGN